MLAQKLISGSGEDKIWADDCFAVHAYTGNGSTQTITNGIDLAGKGGMVWTKGRNTATNHGLYDTARGATKYFSSNLTNAETTRADGLTSFTSAGYTLGADAATESTNANTYTYVSHTFRKAPKFFDVVTYTGNSSGGSSQTIAHGLGIEPGLIIVKATSIAGENWAVWHRSFTANQVIYLNTTAAVSSQPAGNSFPTLPTATDFTVGYNGNQNGSGTTYIAYLFAHDTSADGIIQCGSFTTDGSGNATVTLGWEPQYLMVKSSSAVDSWVAVDSMRGFVHGASASTSDDQTLNPNNSSAESTNNVGRPLATGFDFNGAASRTYIYTVIRRPNKPPTSGTQVYNAIARTGTGAAATVTGVGFAPDLVHSFRLDQTSQYKGFCDRLRGKDNFLRTSQTSAEQDTSGSPALTAFTNDGIVLGSDAGYGYINAGSPYINLFFRRAVGVMDQVCWSGNSTTNTAIAHNLGVAPELIIIKSRSTATDWNVYANIQTSSFAGLYLQTTGADYGGTYPGTLYSKPTATNVYLNGDGSVNLTGRTYVAYLFATKTGISCVTNYTGNGGAADSAGSSQTINCGFTTGSRFVMLKCTSHTSDWIIVDTVRGLVAGNDPTLSLNTTAAEVTGQDLLDPASEGFVVNQIGSGAGTSANFNVTGRTYIVLSFA